MLMCQSATCRRLETKEASAYKTAAPAPRTHPGIVRLARTAGAFGLLLAASGCLEINRPELAIGIRDSYRAAYSPAEAATPALDWWRSFRSRELTSLMEQALTANLDIAVAIASAMTNPHGKVPLQRGVHTPVVVSPEGRVLGADPSPAVRFDLARDWGRGR